eukprot:8558187-Heterocapsa_arctica.AAC.1
MRRTFWPKVERQNMDLQKTKRTNVNYKVALATHVQEHMLRTYVRYIQHTLVREDALKHTKDKRQPHGQERKTYNPTRANGT